MNLNKIDRQQMILARSEREGSRQSAEHELDALSSCMRLARRPFSLRFKSRAIEQNYLLEVASGRLPIFIATASFDVVLLLIKVLFTAFYGSKEGTGLAVLRIFVNGLVSLIVLYSLIGLIYRRSQRSGLAASRVSARQDCWMFNSTPLPLSFLNLTYHLSDLRYFYYVPFCRVKFFWQPSFPSFYAV